MSEAAVYTTSVFSEGVYTGAGVDVARGAVVAGGTAVVGAGVGTPVVVAGCAVTAVLGGIVAGGEVVVVQQAKNAAITRTQAILIAVNRYVRQDLSMKHQSNV